MKNLILKRLAPPALVLLAAIGYWTAGSLHAPAVVADNTVVVKPVVLSEIDGPTTGKVGRLITFTLKGLVDPKPTDLGALVRPMPSDAQVNYVLNFFTRELQVQFVADTPGKYALVVAVYGEKKLFAHDFELTGTGPNPGPTPDPDPPDPTPPPVTQKLVIVFVEETSERTPEYAQIVSSKKLRDYCVSKGHKLYFVDDDADTVQTGAYCTPAGCVAPRYERTANGWTQFINRAAGKTLPYMTISDLQLKEVQQADAVIPRDRNVDDVINHLKKYGG